MAIRFRASPWVSYDPTTTNTPNRPQHTSHNRMEDDVDMEAPQISILREEETPPPQVIKKRAKITARRGGVVPRARPIPQPPLIRNVRDESEEEHEDPEEEEDQLIDDDDDELNKPVSISVLQAGRSGEGSKKQKVSAKRKPRKSEKQAAEEKQKAQVQGVPDVGATISWFSATVSDIGAGEQADAGPTGLSGPAEPGSSKGPSAKKKPTPRKSAAKPKVKAAPKLKLAYSLPAEDVGMASEATGTAASSPVATHFEVPEVRDNATPEQEQTASVAPAVSAAPVLEDINLDNVPQPLYPLPTKPFPVQPPPKISTGFAPLIPLDKTGKKVRHWRTAHREIRGIAGGRWLARSWVGNKDSEFASALAAAAQSKGLDDKAISGLTLPKLSAVSISAPPLGKGPGRSKGSKAANSLSVSAAPSRDGSATPDAPLPIANSSTVRAPTKMRTIVQLAPSEGGDSDMAAPPDP